MYPCELDDDWREGVAKGYASRCGGVMQALQYASGKGDSQQLPTLALHLILSKAGLLPAVGFACDEGFVPLIH